MEQLKIAIANFDSNNLDRIDNIISSDLQADWDIVVEWHHINNTVVGRLGVDIPNYMDSIDAMGLEDILLVHPEVENLD